MNSGKLKTKTIGFFVEIAALIFALLALIGYTMAGMSDSYGFVLKVDIFLGLGIVVGIVFLVRDFIELGSIVTTALLSAGFGFFVNNRFMYYSHLYYGIASDPISVAMILATVGFAGMLICSFVAAYMPWNRTNEEVHE